MMINANDITAFKALAARSPVSASEFAAFLEATGIPLVGVTGRRHIVPEARDAVESAALKTLPVLARGRTICVATGLAIGADQLAMESVLAAMEFGARIIAVALLPMSVAEYRRDFSTEPRTGRGTASELDDFHRYLASADLIVEIEPTAENVERKKRGEPIDRMAQYAALGDFLVERSRLLWAFWSGDASNVKRGGTADVVLRKSRRVPSGGAGAEAICCVATPEVLRFKNPDGTKTRVPEPIENAGKVAFWTTPSDAVPTFEKPENVAERLKRFVKTWNA